MDYVSGAVPSAPTRVTPPTRLTGDPLEPFADGRRDGPAARRGPAPVSETMAQLSGPGRLPGRMSEFGLYLQYRYFHAELDSLPINPPREAKRVGGRANAVFPVGEPTGISVALTWCRSESLAGPPALHYRRCNRRTSAPARSGLIAVRHAQLGDEPKSPWL